MRREFWREAENFFTVELRRALAEKDLRQARVIGGAVPRNRRRKTSHSKSRRHGSVRRDDQLLPFSRRELTQLEHRGFDILSAGIEVTARRRVVNQIHIVD